MLKWRPNVALPNKTENTDRVHYVTHYATTISLIRLVSTEITWLPFRFPIWHQLLPSKPVNLNIITDVVRYVTWDNHWLNYLRHRHPACLSTDTPSNGTKYPSGHPNIPQIRPDGVHPVITVISMPSLAVLTYHSTDHCCLGVRVHWTNYQTKFVNIVYSVSSPTSTLSFIVLMNRPNTKVEREL